MNLATPQEMKLIDGETISSGYSRTIDLMERAGEAIAREAELLTKKNESVSIFCGKGNNGGDGLVAGRYLLQKKRKVRVYLFAIKRELKKEPKKNLQRFLKLKGDVVEITDASSLKKLAECRSSSVIIDAIFGIGLKGAPTGVLAKGIDFINDLKKKVIAADVPSGLDAGRGVAYGRCVEAFKTVTLGLGKPGLFIAPGINFAGEVKIADIGLSPQSMQKIKFSHYLIEKSEMRSILPKRSRDSHKGECGHVLVIAGSPGLTGAACLASSGALLSGAGLVTLGLPQSLNAIAEAKLTEVMTKPLPETEEKSIARRALPLILDFSKRCKSIAIGPGLSRNSETSELVTDVIRNITIPTVIDADGLFALADNPGVLKEAKAPFILTPHPGEMARLVNKNTSDIKEDRLNIAAEFSKKYSVIVVLKGAGTVISEPGGNIYINPTGNPSLSSGGTGDVLTGIIASLLAQGLSPVEAAKLGVYIHGMAADEISLYMGPWGVTATDILTQLPESMYNLNNSR